MTIKIEDNIPEQVALRCVLSVVNQGKISKDMKGNNYYCWATTFETSVGEIAVYTRKYKNTSFIVKKT